MKFLIALAVIAAAVGEEAVVPAAAAPLVRDGVLSSFVPSPVNVVEPKLLDDEISRDSSVQFINEPLEVSDLEIAAIKDTQAVADLRIRFSESSSPEIDSVNVAVLDNQNDPIPEDLRFHMLNNVKAEPLVVPQFRVEHDAPIPERLKVESVDGGYKLLEAINMKIPQPSKVQDSRIRVKFIEGQEWPVSENLIRVLPFFYAVLSENNPIVLGALEPLENQDAISADLRVKIFDGPFDTVSSIKTGASQVPENGDVPVQEDLKVRFVDATLPYVDTVKETIPQGSETPSVSEGLKVQFVEEPKKSAHVNNVDLSKPGKVYPNLMWR